MGRPRKDNVPVSFRLERTVFDKLNQFCEDSGQAKTVAIERALGMYIDDYYEKQEIIKNNEQRGKWWRHFICLKRANNY